MSVDVTTASDAEVDSRAHAGSQIEAGAHAHHESHDHGTGHPRSGSDGFVIHVVIGLVTVIVGRLAFGGGYRAFVRVGMRWPLVIAVVVLGGFVIADLIARRSAPSHGGHLRPGIYLIVPVLLALAVAPQPLGSYAAERSNVIPSPTSPFPALVSDGGPAELTLLEFNQRAIDRGGETLDDVPVRLTGFVMAGGDLRIARFRLACCAADGQAAIVQLAGVDSRPPADGWVTVEGHFSGMSGALPLLMVDRIEPITQPGDPYEPT